MDLVFQCIREEISNEFKRLFIAENEKGKFPRDIFEECGFDIDIIGLKRIQSSGSRWRSAFRRNGVEQLQDTRKFNTGRPTEKDLSLEEKYEKLQAKLKLLQAENANGYILSIFQTWTEGVFVNHFRCVY